MQVSSSVPLQCVTLFPHSPLAVSNVEVLEVRWEEKLMAFNLSAATNYSQWLNILVRQTLDSLASNKVAPDRCPVAGKTG